MDNIVYIFGHQNPDTDSTCSAIAYANLKNKVDSSKKYIPAILGEINKETQYVLNKFNVEIPIKLNNLKPQVSDIELTKVKSVKEDDSIKTTLNAIIDQVGRSIPVVDNNERLIGIVSISDILPLYFETNNNNLLEIVSTPIKNLIETLNLKVIRGEVKDTTIQGKILLYCDIADLESVTSKDVILCNVNEFNKHNICNNNKASYIIVSGVEDSKEIKIGHANNNNTIMITKLSIFDIIKLIGQALPIGSVVKKENLHYFTTYETIDDVKKNMLTSKYRRFPVVDEWGTIKGMISRSNLVEIRKKKAILVDHNERGQSIEGIEDVEILEVIDHHRVADIQTMAPLYFRVEPLGCTCTIVAKMYEELNINIDKKIAGIMLSAILSDTLLFKSPTCTNEDKTIAYKLADIAGVDINKYGIKMITKGSNLSGKDPKQLITSDMKRFMFGKYKVMISQINTGDFEGLYSMLNDIKNTMNEFIIEESYDLVVLMITDIIVGGTELIAFGEAKWIAENAFGMKEDDESIFLNGVFSRKKQVVPQLMKAAKL